MHHRKAYIYYSLLLTLVLLISTVAIARPSNRNTAKPKDFTLTLKAKSETIILGEQPTLTATIINNSDKEVLLVPTLDGSIVGWRYPIVKFIVTQPSDAPPPQIFGRCGNTNNIQASDFTKVPKKGIFRLFSQSAYMSNNPFTTPGTYTVQLIYSTDAKSKKWNGRWGLGLGSELSRNGIRRHLAKVPIMNLKSNVVTIVVVAWPEKVEKTIEGSL